MGFLRLQATPPGLRPAGDRLLHARVTVLRWLFEYAGPGSRQGTDASLAILDGSWDAHTPDSWAEAWKLLAK